MARFRRRRFRRRGRGRNRRFIRKVRRITKTTIRRMSEIKRVVVNGSFNTTNTWALTEITPAIPQGIDKDNRIGNKIKYRYFILDVLVWAITLDASVGPATTVPVRLCLHTGRSINTSPGEVLEDGAPAAPSLPWIWVPLRPESVNVLKDKKFVITGLAAGGTAADSATANVPSIRRIKLSMRLPRSVTFSSASATQPENPVDRIYLLCGSTQANVTVQYYYNGRMSYIDI